MAHEVRPRPGQHQAQMEVRAVILYLRFVLLLTLAMLIIALVPL